MELLEIEKELSGPGREDALVRYDRVLANLATRVKAALREGLPPDEYERAEMLDGAVVVARKLLRLQVRGRTNGVSVSAGWPDVENKDTQEVTKWQ